MNIKIFKRLVKLSILQTINFRITSFIMLIVSILFFLLEIFTGFILFKYTKTIAGFTRYDYFNLIITGHVITSLYYMIFSYGNNKIITDILYGRMDYIFIRPVNSFFYYVFYWIDLESLVTLILYTVLQVILLCHQTLGLSKIIMYVLSILIGVVYMAIINTLIAMIAFYTDRATALFGVTEILEDLGKNPKNIYPSSIKVVLTYIIAYAYVYNLPVNILQSKVDLFNTVVYLLTCIILSNVVYRLWFKSIERYQSAN